MGNGRKQGIKDSEEHDAVTGWRQLLYWKRGQLKRIKRRPNKRYRKEAKQKIKGKLDE